METEKRIILEFNDLTGDGGVLKKIEIEGFGSIPPEASEITVNYDGTMEDNRIIDNTRIRQEPYSFILGKGTVISGLEIAVKTMKIGEKAKFKIRSDYGYGNKDLALNIPPKKLSEMEESEAKKYSNLIYEVELVKHDKVRKSRTQLNPDERIAEAIDLKQMGNELFKEKRYREAIIRFEDGLKYLTQIPTQELTQKIIDLRSTFTLNVTNCFIQLYEYNYALKKVNESFDIKSTPKCYYYRCIAYMNLAEFSKAEEDLKALEKLLPGEKQVENTRKDLEQLKEKHTKQKKALFKKGLTNSSLYDDVKIKEKGIYPEVNQKNLFVFLDILIGFKSLKFRDPKKIKIEIYLNLHKEIANYFFKLIETNKESFKKIFKLKRYEVGFYGLCLMEKIEDESLLLENQKNNLPLSNKGLLIIERQTRSIFVSLNELPNDNKNNSNYLVIGKLCYGDDVITNINREIISLSNTENFDVNQIAFEITDMGRSLII